MDKKNLVICILLLAFMAFGGLACQAQGETEDTAGLLDEEGATAGGPTESRFEAGDEPFGPPSEGSARNLMHVESIPVPNTRLFDEFEDLHDWQKKLFVNSTDEETYRLLVERYGADEIGRYVDDDQD